MGVDFGIQIDDTAAPIGKQEKPRPARNFSEWLLNFSKLSRTQVDNALSA